MHAGRMKKDPSGVGTAGVLVLTTNLDACSWEANAPGICNFDPGTFLKLYKRAHSEMTVYKSNNSTSGFAAIEVATN
jgi:hypothetical protein